MNKNAALLKWKDIWINIRYFNYLSGFFILIDIEDVHKSVERFTLRA